MSIQDKLTPSHLAPSEEARKEAVAASQTPVTPPADDRKRRMEARRYTWRFEYKPKRGDILAGEFTSEIPDQSTQGSIDAMQAQLTGFAPVSSLTDVAFGRALMRATLTYCLVVRPDWAKDLGKILDPGVMPKLYAEVLEHQETFLG